MIDWTSDVPLTKAEIGPALKELFKGQVNEGEMVCPICAGWYKVGSTWGLGWCGDCGFRSADGRMFRPARCPDWIKGLNFTESFFLDVPPINDGAEFIPHYESGDRIEVCQQIGKVHPGNYIVVTHSREFWIRRNSVTTGGILYMVAPIQVDHLGNYKLITL